LIPAADVAPAHDHGERVHAETRTAWAGWLEGNHDRTDGVWLVSWKKHTGRPAVGYDDAVTEALRFGWIDSLGRSSTTIAACCGSRPVGAAAGGRVRTSSASRGSNVKVGWRRPVGP